MALQYFKVLNAETKQQIDMVYGWDREDVLKKVERNKADYEKYSKAKSIALIPATDAEISAEAEFRRAARDIVYKTAGTAD